MVSKINSLDCGVRASVMLFFGIKFDTETVLCFFKYTGVHGSRSQPISSYKHVLYIIRKRFYRKRVTGMAE